METVLFYGALVKYGSALVHPRYPLWMGHGNFGSRGPTSSAAAMRYKEARLSKISMAMMEDINKDTGLHAEL